uniref:Uncharacterized protein n=1 Tax=Nelumbo nucifera TaxID=4432 RepID=A0A822Z4F3_NELNU|nr:TPA_asm: hypothetical protein HUJ06_009016 [Nelumbo nucifera]
MRRILPLFWCREVRVDEQYRIEDSRRSGRRKRSRREKRKKEKEIKIGEGIRRLSSLLRSNGEEE